MANLDSANFTEANLARASLVNSDLSLAILTNANLTGAKLGNANLKRASLVGTNLSGANLSDADLSDAEIGFTLFVNNDLRLVKGLTSVFHTGSSSIGIGTIYRSEGNIPEIFLRGAGVPDTFITYLRSLVGKPLDYYTCFISYASPDQAFAERLHADLQAAGVRCWFAPENMRIGDKINSRIDESIRLYDKLLLVLSQHSIILATGTR